MTIAAGRLNRRVTYQESTETVDRAGQVHLTWATVGTYWAAITSHHGKKVTVAEQLKAEVSHVLTLRYPGFNYLPTGRFLYGARVFSIAAVIDVDEANREVVAYCTEVIDPP